MQEIVDCGFFVLENKKTKYGIFRYTKTKKRSLFRFFISINYINFKLMLPVLHLIINFLSELPFHPDFKLDCTVINLYISIYI